MARRDTRPDFRRPELQTPWQRASGHRAFAPIVIVSALAGTSALVLIAVHRLL